MWLNDLTIQPTPNSKRPPENLLNTVFAKLVGTIAVGKDKSVTGIINKNDKNETE